MLLSSHSWRSRSSLAASRRTALCRSRCPRPRARGCSAGFGHRGQRPHPTAERSSGRDADRLCRDGDRRLLDDQPRSHQGRPSPATRLPCPWYPPTVGPRRLSGRSAPTARPRSPQRGRPTRVRVHAHHLESHPAAWRIVRPAPSADLMDFYRARRSATASTGSTSPRSTSWKRRWAGSAAPPWPVLKDRCSSSVDVGALGARRRQRSG